MKQRRTHIIITAEGARDRAHGRGERHHEHRHHHGCSASEGGEDGRRGRGGPWGRGHRGGRDGEGRGPGRGRRMFGPGDLRLVLLALIEQQPRHGYDLIKAVEALFGGAYAPSPGVVYPNLSMLSDEGLIQGVEAGGKQVFSLTEAGALWLTENRAVVDEVMQRMTLAARRLSGEQTPEVVREAFHALRHAVQSKPGDWSEAETAKVVEVLMKATRDLGEG